LKNSLLAPGHGWPGKIKHCKCLILGAPQKSRLLQATLKKAWTAFFNILLGVPSGETCDMLGDRQGCCQAGGLDAEQIDDGRDAVGFRSVYAEVGCWFAGSRDLCADSRVRGLQRAVG
jgi:hypothetical protein